MEVTGPVIYFKTREEWRQWLEENFQTEKEMWFIFPNKASGKQGVLYNDAVEEALCFGWIDSTAKSLDEMHKIQRFTPRNRRSTYSQLNKERLKCLKENGMIHKSIRDDVNKVLSEKFVFPDDIIKELKKDKEVWKNYQTFSDSYKRIRIAYIDTARKRPEEMQKRLENFIKKTKENKLIRGYGGTEKYY